MAASSFDLATYFATYTSVLQRIDHRAVEGMAEAVFDAWRGKRTVYLCGNGGNAANSMHIAADLVKLTAPAHGRRLRAVALGETLAGLTAVANDIDYEQVYAEQLRAFLSRHDVVIGLSTSGSSPNVLRAIEYANEAGAVTIGITGLGGHKLRASVRFPIVVTSSSVQQIEDATMVIGHLVCLIVRDRVLASVGDTRSMDTSGAGVNVSMPLATAADRAPSPRQGQDLLARKLGHTARAIS